MNRKALIAINITREQPATILDVLQKRGWQSTIVNLEQGVAQIWKDFLEMKDKYTKTATTLYNNFLDIAER